MTRFLLLGFSSIAQRRVLPALVTLGIKHVDVASRSAADVVKLPHGLNGRIFDNYTAALRQSEAEIVYISTTNNLHAELAVTAIETGRHVVIDKPATTSMADTHRLVSLAEKKGCLLAEATVYAYHPQIAAVQTVFKEINSRPTRIAAAFSFPRLPASNFRYRPEFGGGAFWDLGPYAVSPGRLFFEAAPVEIVCRPFIESGDNVETGFSLLAIYPDGRSFVGHYGMGTGYINQMQILGPDTFVTLNRVFTTPADMICELQISQYNKLRNIIVPAADSFAQFLESALQAIKHKMLQPFANDLFADAMALEQLRLIA